MNRQPPATESELVELVQSIDVRAPERLHAQIQALIAERSTRRRPAWMLMFDGSPTPARRLGGAVAAAAAVALALVLALGGGGSGRSRLTLQQASTLTLRAATMAAPEESAGNRSELAASVDGVAFPYWEERFGWRSTGAREDRLGGRAVTTVFYANAGGQRIGYAIVAGTPAPVAYGGKIAWHDGTPYRLMIENGAPTVTWTRNGHLCVVSGRGVASATLLKLASWNDQGTAA